MEKNLSLHKLDRHSRVTIMGLGLFGGGLGAARFWTDLGAQVTVTDLRPADELTPSLEKLKDCNCRLVLGRHEKEDFAGADLVVVNQAVKPGNEFVRLAKNTGAQIVTEIGLTLRLIKGPLLGVTGSNGKSTTTALLGQMLKQEYPQTLVGGNIGGSLLDDLKSHPPTAPVVLELSSFQLHYLKEVGISPKISVVTNLAPNHLDWHKTTLHYYESKRNIVNFHHKGDTAILLAGDKVLEEWANNTSARAIFTALSEPDTEHACYLQNDIITLRLDGVSHELADINLLKLPGEHNRLNALQAAAACFIQCRKSSPVKQGMQTFGGLPHRLEKIAEVGGVSFINDSIATTPESAICALESFDCPLVLIAGGYDKGAEFDELAEKIVEKNISLVLIGNAAEKIGAAMSKAMTENYSGKIVYAETDFEQAIKNAQTLCPEGGAVLLSPACASYDMFKSFEDRATQFSKIVAGL